MVDYNKMKVEELKAVLTERKLDVTGKKADLVKKLQDDDAQKVDSAPAASTSKTETHEDEIDWDDDINDATKATTEPAASAMAAGGQGQVDNPQAVPNQEAAIEPSETKDLSVSEPVDQPAPVSDSLPATDAPPAEEKKDPVDFSAGIAATTLEKEIEKRKARAKKFGLDESTDETLKALERQQKFGGTEAELTGRLNEALPEKREKKRPRDVPEEATSRKRTRPGPGGRKESGSKEVAKAPAPKKAAASAGGNAPKLSEADRAKAEARKARFASAS